ncbi:hypothetical protein HUF15_40445 [Streptomyces samsunensis]|uniref:hypothetical protein n=1 Tax=Streptomyces malaysiensis TaxID=92644 RepID=UPI001581CEC2|nr:hypothetical protein [Streptomyces samsunensis]NUH42891.1 hypothetical protein [Streptomyces samsunensis]
MRKVTTVQAGAVFVAGCVAGDIGYRLSGHQVGAAYITAIVVGSLSVGLVFASPADRTITFTCPVKGCTVSIRARDTSAEELERLRALATDHSKHGRAA